MIAFSPVVDLAQCAITWLARGILRMLLPQTVFHCRMRVKALVSWGQLMPKNRTSGQNVLLVTPSTVSSPEEVPGWYRRFSPHSMPMALPYLASVLRKGGFSVKLVDQFTQELDNDRIIRQIEAEKPAVVGYSVLSAAMSNVEDLAKRTRQVSPESIIVLGNIHASHFSQEILESGIADVVVRGEGEATIVELIQALSAGESLSGVKGLSYRHNGEVVHNPPREAIEDLDSIPFPSWDLMELDAAVNSRHPVSGFYEMVLPLQGSRGCPYRCIYCSQEKNFKRMRYRSAKSIADEMEHLGNTLGVRHFLFVDASFPPTRKIGLRFWEEMKRRRLGSEVKWSCQCRVDIIDDELMGKLKEVGLEHIHFGFEVGNQKILDTLGKNTTLEQGMLACQITKKHKIRTHGFFILGLPGETVETCKETIAYAKRVDPDLAQFSLATPYPGSELFEMVKDDIAHNDSRRFASFNYWKKSNKSVPYVPDGMTEQQILTLHRLGMFSFYARPRKVLSLLLGGNLKVRHLLYGTILVDRLLRTIMSEAAARAVPRLKTLLERTKGKWAHGTTAHARGRTTSRERGSREVEAGSARSQQEETSTPRTDGKSRISDLVGSKPGT